MEYISFIDEKFDASITLILLMIVLVYIGVTKFPHILDAIDRLKYGKIEPLEKALESEHINERTKTSFKMLLQHNYFQKLTGLRVSQLEREKLIELHILSEGEISYEEIRDIMFYIDFDKEKGGFVLNKYSEKLNGYTRSMSYMYILGGTAFLILAYLNTQEIDDFKISHPYFLLVGLPALFASIVLLYSGFGSLNNNRKITMAQDFIKKQNQIFNNNLENESD